MLRGDSLLPDVQQYVIAPKLSAVGSSPSTSKTADLINRFALIENKTEYEDAPIVVTMNYEKAREAVRLYRDDVIVAPLVRYTLADAPTFPPTAQLFRRSRSIDLSAGSKQIKIKVVGTDNVPIAGATVFASINSRIGMGIKGVTDLQGDTFLEISSKGPDLFEEVYIIPENSYWSVHRIGLPIADQEIQVNPLPEVNGYQWWAYMTNCVEAHNRENMGTGVRVAVIDSGTGPHSDLKIANGRNFTSVGSVTSFEDVDGHGTHAGGIIAANGRLLGTAPKVDLYSARVFPSKNEDAINADIATAIQVAVDEWQCDIINLSIEGSYDPVIEDRINYAIQNGVLCIAAAGNSGGPVAYPGALDNTYCVAAVGQLGRYPELTIHKLAEPHPGGLIGKDNIYAAAFSSRGSQVDTCAPGVAIISTVLSDKYSALDGTSMASPVVSGIASLVVEYNKKIKNYPRSKEKVDLIRNNINSILDDIRLPSEIQGKGFVTI